jgi:hypothetical protein
MARTKMSFTSWMAAVNSRLVSLCMLEANDLPDWHYADAFESGMSPAVAARSVLKASGEF